MFSIHRYANTLSLFSAKRLVWFDVAFLLEFNLVVSILDVHPPLKVTLSMMLFSVSSQTLDPHSFSLKCLLHLCLQSPSIQMLHFLKTTCLSFHW